MRAMPVITMKPVGKVMGALSWGKCRPRSEWIVGDSYKGMSGLAI
jgi:hypothetical protein